MDMAAYKNKVRVAAHRGNSCVCPENTLVAMRSALELPVDMLEIDLHMTKDGHIILMHDLYGTHADLKHLDLPELRACAKVNGPVALIHFDAHYDTIHEYFGKPYNHGTPFYHAAKEGLVEQECSYGDMGRPRTLYRWKM